MGIVDGVGNAGIIALHPFLKDHFADSGTVFLYAVNCGIGHLLLDAYLPETRGLTLEEVQALLAYGSTDYYRDDVLVGPDGEKLPRIVELDDGEVVYVPADEDGERAGVVGGERAGGSEVGGDESVMEGGLGLL